MVRAILDIISLKVEIFWVHGADMFEILGFIRQANLGVLLVYLFYKTPTPNRTK